ncbi:MAG: C40 family peptidase [Treponema sp.]|jgi:cell wall-associated NlpC family hydrolase|nr:C40 family peptidase [Treponema sp.]
MKRTLCAVTIVLFIASATADDREALIALAQKYLGTPYRSAGDNPKGFDCSGFVWFVYRNAVNMNIPRSSKGVWTSDAETTTLENAHPGDIIIFSSQKGGRGSINHSAMLLDENSMIHAISDGPRRGVVISPLSDKYFGPRIIGVKRFLPWNQND